jgi:hypothetical protein
MECLRNIAGSKIYQQKMLETTIEPIQQTYSLYRQLEDASIDASIRAVLVELHTTGVVRHHGVFNGYSLAPDVPHPIRALLDM